MRETHVTDSYCGLLEGKREEKRIGSAVAPVYSFGTGMNCFLSQNAVGAVR